MASAPNLIPSYEVAIAAFRAADVAATLHGDLAKGFNACIECCDRHAASGRVALKWRGKDGRQTSLTFAELQEKAARFANVIADRGVKPGEVVAGLLPGIRDLLTVVLRRWRAGAVYQPLFTAFGPKAIEHRLR